MTHGGKNDKSVAPKSILSLVERFELYQESYRSGQYNEAQLRHDFLDPFWEILGWDIHNKQGFAEAYRDVIYEGALRIGHATKAPDYCFRIGGTRKFFLEAKKPSVLIKEDVSPAFQLRRYAWSAKLPLSVLSNFEEFVVYDTHVRPVKDDPASTARIFCCTFREYAEKWDWIASIFSRDAVLKGSFDKFAEGTRAKRGTASVDDAFLDEIEAWRKSLAQNLALRNPKLTQRELNFAVQTIIDRVIFLRICEDRNIEDYGRLLALVNGGDIYQRLCELFQEADDKYNSGLFHFKAEKGRHEPPDELTPGLHVDDKLLRDVLRNLYYPESPYEFSVLSIDILGQVYERFLGKTIRLTEGHRAVVEEKPEVKKAGGIYYTPTYIVNYIVRNTVGKLLEGKTPAQVAKLRILDPACGSGSFLIGAYQYLLDWHLDWYAANDPEKRTKGSKPVLLQVGARGWRLTIAERKRILLNNIFGVDIDSQAVEVTKLSLLLKVLEGETEQTLQPMLRFFHERALPDLGENIKCGNSLVDSDFYDRQQMLLLNENERFRINHFDWSGEDGFSEVMRTGGFDVVIGNPPYILLQQDFRDDRQIKYFRSKFEGASYKLDTYHLFIEQGIRLSRQGGRCGMITPANFLTNNYLHKLRHLILERSAVDHILVVDGGVFQGVSVDNAVLVLAPGKKTMQDFAIVHALATSTGFQETSRVVVSIKRSLRDKHVLFTGSSDRVLSALWEKVANKSVSLGEIADINFGKQLRDRNKFQEDVVSVADLKAVRRNYRPCYTGRDVARYRLEWSNLACLNDDIAQRGGCWDVAKHDAKSKLVTRQIGRYPDFAIDARGYQCLNTMFMVNLKVMEPSPRFVLGVLNSKLMQRLWLDRFYDQRRTFPKIKGTYLKQLPIVRLNLANQAERAHYNYLEKLAQRMVELHRKQAKTPAEQTALARQIAATDAQIDRLVYQLYGLTEQEIKIVESAT